jgi:ABC-type dipeptide/oligopeptide/nickel transport system permease component
MGRLAGMFVALWAVSLITFVALATIPGDAASALIGESASREQLDSLREELGLSKPLPARYVTFVANLLRGDLGRSMISNRPVSQLIWERLPYTLILAGAAVVLALVIGGVSGAVAGLHAGGYLDALIMGGVSVGIAVPTFWSSLLLVMVFSLKLGWLPVVGADSARHLLLPAFVLALPTAAILARLLRSGLHDALGADYVRTAHAKGLTSQQVVMRHALRNSLVPVVAVMGLQIGYLIGGAFVVETVFAWPGMGRLLVQAIFDRDYPVVMGTALVIAASYLVINLLVDLAHGCLDPRVGEEAI